MLTAALSGLAAAPLALHVARAALAARRGPPGLPDPTPFRPFLTLIRPVLWAATFARRGFDWRGTEMRAAPAAAK